MAYTYATVIIAAADQAAAQTDLPECFTCGLSADGSAPATHYITSGPWGNDELEHIVNGVTWGKRVAFGSDAQAVLAELNLRPVSTSIDNESVV